MITLLKQAEKLTRDPRQIPWWSQDNGTVLELCFDMTMSLLKSTEKLKI